MQKKAVIDRSSAPLTIDEAAAALGICRRQMFDFIQEGLIEAFDARSSSATRRSLRIPQSSLVEFMQKRRTPATRPAGQTRAMVKPKAFIL